LTDNGITQITHSNKKVVKTVDGYYPFLGISTKKQQCTTPQLNQEDNKATDVPLPFLLQKKW
jgi:hypothetical protein